MDIISLLTGAVIALVAPIATGYFNLFVKKREFQNEYFKQIVSKRLLAYEQLNILVYKLKQSVQDNSDGQLYHLVFLNEGNIRDFYNTLLNILQNSFWYSNDINNLVLELQRYFSIQIPDSSIGKKEYVNIATLRDKIESTLANNLSKLYDVEDFLKNKKVKTHFLKRTLDGEYSELTEEEKQHMKNKS